LVVRHLTTLLVIAAVVWLSTALLFVLEDSAMPRLRLDVAETRHARGVRTHLIVLRRVTVVVVTILAVGAGRSGPLWRVMSGGTVGSAWRRWPAPRAVP
jgi:hypothetical protein